MEGMETRFDAVCVSDSGSDEALERTERPVMMFGLDWAGKNTKVQLNIIPQIFYCNNFKGTASKLLYVKIS